MTTETMHTTGMATRAVVLTADDSGVRVALEDHPALELSCSVLEVSQGKRLELVAGDVVVVCCTNPELGEGVVLGRLPCGRSQMQTDDNEHSDERPDELVIEARRSLTLKVGDGSITIREDGRILIKGRDLVSHAKRNNRIRGGSVQIN